MPDLCIRALFQCKVANRGLCHDSCVLSTILQSKTHDLNRNRISAFLCHATLISGNRDTIFPATYCAATTYVRPMDDTLSPVLSVYDQDAGMGDHGPLDLIGVLIFLRVQPLLGVARALAKREPAHAPASLPHRRVLIHDPGWNEAGSRDPQTQRRRSEPGQLGKMPVPDQFPLPVQVHLSRQAHGTGFSASRCAGVWAARPVFQHARDVRQFRASADQVTREVGARFAAPSRRD